MRFDSSTLCSISDVVPLGEISSTQHRRWISIGYAVLKGIAKGRTLDTAEMQEQVGTKQNPRIKVLASYK